MKQQIKLDASDKRWWDYRELANTHSARHRLICVLGMAVFGQISGNSVTSYYLVVMLVSGYNSVNRSEQKLIILAIAKRWHHIRKDAITAQCNQPSHLLLRSYYWRPND